MPRLLSTLTLRRASVEDLPALLALEAHSFRTDRLGVRSFRRFLQAPNSILVVAELNGAVLGYGLLLLHHAGRVARFYSLAVAEKARGQGVARALMATLEQAAHGAGYSLLRLEVAAGNSAAQKLYQALGFRVFGRREGYYADGSAALRMEKALQGRSTSAPGLQAL